MKKKYYAEVGKFVQSDEQVTKRATLDGSDDTNPWWIRIATSNSSFFGGGLFQIFTGYNSISPKFILFAFGNSENTSIITKLAGDTNVFLKARTLKTANTTHLEVQMNKGRFILYVFANNMFYLTLEKVPIVNSDTTGYTVREYNL